MLLILPRLNNQASRVGEKKKTHTHVSLAGKNDRRQHYLEGRRMARHRAFTAAGRNEQRQRYALSVYERLRGEGWGEERGWTGVVKRNWAKEGRLVKQHNGEKIPGRERGREAGAVFQVS